MVQGNEIVALAVAAAVGLFLLQNRRLLQELPDRGLFYAAFGFALIGRVLTVAEGFLLETAFNLAEHICYACSALALLGWCWRIFIRRGEVS